MVARRVVRIAADPMQGYADSDSALIFVQKMPLGILGLRRIAAMIRISKVGEADGSQTRSATGIRRLRKMRRLGDGAH